MVCFLFRFYIAETVETLTISCLEKSYNWVWALEGYIFYFNCQERKRIKENFGREVFLFLSWELPASSEFNANPIPLTLHYEIFKMYREVERIPFRY